MYKITINTKAIIIIQRKEVIIVDVEQVNNIDRNLKLLGERIEVLEDILFDIRNINIQFSILLGLENQEIKQLLKVSEEEIECFR